MWAESEKICTGKCEIAFILHKTSLFRKGEFPNVHFVRRVTEIIFCFTIMSCARRSKKAITTERIKKSDLLHFLGHKPCKHIFGWLHSQSRTMNTDKQRIISFILYLITKLSLKQGEFLYLSFVSSSSVYLSCKFTFCDGETMKTKIYCLQCDLLYVDHLNSTESEFQNPIWQCFIL